MRLLNPLSIAIALTFATALPATAATTIKIATIAPDGTAWMKEIRATGDAIKKETDGRVELKLYPGGVMGDNATVLRKIKIGQLQGSAFTGGEASVITKDAEIYTVPFLFRSQEEADKVRAKVDPLLKEAVRKTGFELLGLSGGGFAYLMSTKDIKTRDDLKNAKVWVPQGDEIAELTFKTAGVTPVPLPLSDVYTSLQTGLIDTAANTDAGAIAFQWHTKIKHVVDMPVIYVVGEVLIDRKTFDALSAADQKVVTDEFAAGFGRLEKINRSDNTSAREALKQQGITFYVPDAAEQKRWEGVGAETYKQLTEQHAFSPELQKALDAALAEARGGTK
ncbi:MAG TPA: TRAP transporter substrate-binding protein DctP [Rhodanobacteraceae bacterium]|nr:TRAP transporter substrate-binding protein DctP [Rhodanobacteraceae bacterium]